MYQPFLPLITIKILDKKVKKSTKYENIKSTLNTGKTIKDVEIMSKQSFCQLLELQTNEIAYR